MIKPNRMLRNSKHRMDMYLLLSKHWFVIIQPLIVDKEGNKGLEKLNTMLKEVCTYCGYQLEVNSLW